MRKNRDFMLMICGILIVLILGLTIAHTTFNAILRVKDNKSSDLNIVYSSSNISMFGLAGISSGAKVSGTNVTKLEVILEKPGDKIQYLIKFCNNEESSIIYSKLSSSDIMCTDTITGDEEFKFCDKLILEAKVINNEKIINHKDEISSDSCFNFYIDIEYPENESYIVDNPVKISGIDYLLDFDKK